MHYHSNCSEFQCKVFDVTLTIEMIPWASIQYKDDILPV